MGFIRINEKDDVTVIVETGHKLAVRDIKKGEKVIKYGYPIGVATEDIKKGDTVHSHNLKTALEITDEYEYKPDFTAEIKKEPFEIYAYERKNGEIGIRNDIWIIPTVGCVNKIAEKLSQKTGAFAFTHPYGCSQLGGDHKRTQLVLKGLVKHPNAGGVLVLGLGCENNNIGEFKKILGEVDGERIRFLNCQDVGDEIAEGEKIIAELKAICKRDKRKNVPVSKLKIGMKCGGSDGLSGITANPLCGKITDMLTSMGGCAALTEVPEMFGAERVIFSRCENEVVFLKADKLIRDYKNYFVAHGEPISENPSPGNKAGGITTLEEKSLGCVTKGGTAPITDVLTYGERVKNSGLSLLDGPGNDIVAITNLTAAGCHLILFTTGRGTPLGAPVPTVKIATNTALYEKKPQWIDFDAQTGDENSLMELIKEVAEGKKTRSEENGYREIAIMKSGVTL
ncbi:MAG: UxaA family hydrolase [Acutalibacteraceae bacterium]